MKCLIGLASLIIGLSSNESAQRLADELKYYAKPKKRYGKVSLSALPRAKREKHVLLLHGLLTKPDEIEPLGRVLRRLGFIDRYYPNRNTAKLRETREIVIGRIREINRENNGQGVYLVAWSLGGADARLAIDALGDEAPKLVRGLITIDSPIRPDRWKGTNKIVAWIFEKCSGMDIGKLPPDLLRAVITERQDIPQFYISLPDAGFLGPLTTRQEDKCPNHTKIKGVRHASAIYSPKVVKTIAEFLTQN